MKIHKRKLGTKAIEKRLAFHDRSCARHVYSGARKCTCGRNQAIAEFRIILRRLNGLSSRADSLADLPLFSGGVK